VFNVSTKTTRILLVSFAVTGLVVCFASMTQGEVSVPRFFMEMGVF